MMFRGLAYVSNYYCIQIFFICNGCIENCAGKIIFVKKAQRDMDKNNKKALYEKIDNCEISVYNDAGGIIIH